MIALKQHDIREEYTWNGKHNRTIETEGILQEIDGYNEGIGQ